MRFVRIKSVEQQGQLMQRRTRDVLIRQRTQIINALRAHLAELGFVAAQGKAGVNELRAIVTDEDRHQRLREKPDGHVFKGDRCEECVQMPGKMARSDPRPPGLPVVAAVVRAATPLGKTPDIRKNLRQFGSHPGNPGSKLSCA